MSRHNRERRKNKAKKLATDDAVNRRFTTLNEAIVKDFLNRLKDAGRAHGWSMISSSQRGM